MKANKATVTPSHHLCCGIDYASANKGNANNVLYTTEKMQTFNGISRLLKKYFIKKPESLANEG